MGVRKYSRKLPAVIKLYSNEKYWEKVLEEIVNIYMEKYYFWETIRNDNNGIE
ncbi:MAG: hypothetical protein ACOX7R_09940 [Acetivibrionales bacterium]|jgi:hypothetical protein